MYLHMDMNKPQFFIPETLAAAGMSLSGYDFWRKSVDDTKLLEGDIPGARGRGRNSRFSARTIIRFAVMAAATGNRIPPPIALRAASLFADQDSPGRQAGELYPEGGTFLIFPDKGEGMLMNISQHSPFGMPAGAETAIIVDVAAVRARVIAFLEKWNEDTRMRWEDEHEARG